MSEETCEIVQAEERRVIAVRSRTDADGIGDTFGRPPKLYTYRQEAGTKPAGPPYARYFRCDPKGVDMEVGLAVAGEVRPKDDVNPTTLRRTRKMDQGTATRARGSALGSLLKHAGQ